jgi:Cys-tRNA(Pro)/Cys-tRNA(Cys) deacylase
VVVVKANATPATKALTAAKVAFTVRAYEHDPAAPAYGLEAAEALGVEPGRVFKTLLVQSESGLAIGIVPVDRQLDLKAMAAALGVKKVAMADAAAAERATGYVVGGISPIGGKKRLPAILDASAAAHASVLVSGGRRGLDVELAPAELVRMTSARLAPISRTSAGSGRPRA